MSNRKSPPPKPAARPSLAAAMGSPPHLPRPGMMKPSERRTAQFHKPPAQSPSKPHPPKPGKPRPAVFAKLMSALPAGMAGKLKPLAIGGRAPAGGARPRKRKG